MLYILWRKRRIRAVERVVLRVVGRVVEVASRIHDLVHVLGLDLEQVAICICVNQLAALALPPPKPVVVEVVHEVLREVQDAHPDVNEDQTVLVNLDHRKVTIKCVGSWAGYQAPKSVLFVPTHQLDVDPLAEFLHGLPEHTVVHQFVQILLEIAGGLFP